LYPGPARPGSYILYQGATFERDFPNAADFHDSVAFTSITAGRLVCRACIVIRIYLRKHPSIEGDQGLFSSAASPGAVECSVGPHPIYYNPVHGPGTFPVHSQNPPH